MQRMETILGGKPALLLEHQAGIFTLAAVAVLLSGLAYSRKRRISTLMLVHIGCLLAVTVILHTFRLFHLPQGGSITPGGMIPLLLIAFRYGPAGGYLAGFAYGMINLIQDPYLLHPVQLLLDYPLPYMALGLAGYFRNRMYLGAAAGILGRFACHFISGAVFFASYAPPGVSPYWYSLSFNAAYLGPELAICLILLRVLPVQRILLQMGVKAALQTGPVEEPMPRQKN